MPTFDTTGRFRRDWNALDPEQQERFKATVKMFVDALADRDFPKGLRVKAVQGKAGVYEITWAPDGRATFQYGTEKTAGEPHVIWRRIGSHDIFRNA